MKNTNTMNKQNAELIVELLANAGWLDDADENLAYLFEDEGAEGIRQKANQLQKLLDLINPHLDEQIDLNLEELVSEIIEDNQ
jgi:hypothetical protein